MIPVTGIILIGKMNSILSSVVKELTSTHDKQVKLTYELCRIHKKHLEDENMIEIVPQGTYAYLYGTDGYFLGYRETKGAYSVVSMSYIDDIIFDVQELTYDSHIGVKIQRDNDPILYLSTWDSENERAQMFDINIYTVYLLCKNDLWTPYRENRDGCTLKLTYKGSFILRNQFYGDVHEYLNDVIENTKLVQGGDESYAIDDPPLITEVVSLETL